MKSVNTLKILPQTTEEPFISMDYELMQQIKHIVDIAPKEAQWFHIVEPMQNKEFRLSEMFIPEQICSSVEVDTTSQMMINFWNELKEKYGMLDASNKLSKMTVWCHSHHNMAPNPSGQDNRQFQELVKQQKDAGTNRPVIMFIFNKKDDYYCRLWDPESNLIYEGLEIVYTSYDMSWIDKEAKLKFKEPAPKINTPVNVKATSYWVNPPYNKPTLQTTSYNAKLSTNYDDDIYGLHSLNYNNIKNKTAASCAESKMSSIFGSEYNPLSIVTKPFAESFVEFIYEDLESEEKYILINLLKGQTDFYQKAKDSKNRKFNRKQYTESAIKALTTDKIDFSYLEQLLVNTFEMYDQLIIEDKENFDLWNRDFIDYTSEYSTEPQYSMFTKQDSYTPFNK